MMKEPRMGQQSSETQDHQKQKAAIDHTFISQLTTYLEMEDELTPEQLKEREQQRKRVDQAIAKIPRLDFPNEHDKESLDRFFTTEVLNERVIFCPKIAIDTLDHWESFGNEPGYIIILGMNYEGERCLADKLFLEGSSLNKVEGIPVPGIASFTAGFPRDKFIYVLASQHHNPEVLKYLNNKIKRSKALPSN